MRRVSTAESGLPILLKIVSHSRSMLARTLSGLAAFVAGACLSVVPPAGADAPFAPLATGWTAEGYVDPNFEAERTQIALDDAGRPVAMWAGRTTELDPLRILYSVFDGSSWSPAVPAFPPGTDQDMLPQVSRAANGTLWLVWQRANDGFSRGSSPNSVLLAARFEAGVWSAPETLAVNLAHPNRELFGIEFSLLAVSQDSAWVAFVRDPLEDPFSTDRDLYYVVHSAAGWSPARTLSAAGLAENRPVLSRTAGGAPVVFFSFSNAPSILWAMRWDGASWIQGPGDTFAAEAVYEHAAAPDTSGAVRLMVMLRENDLVTREDHLRELLWNDSGFRPSTILATLPVVKGTGNEAPDWRSLGLFEGGPCAACPPGSPSRYRVFWVDLTPGGAPKLLSSERALLDFLPIDSPGTSALPEEALPSATYDAGLDRWYVVWTSPPVGASRRRAKFAWTQEFAGDLSVGASFVPPDTSRVTVVCSGDATGREFLLYRLAWDEGQGNPPLVPPVPVAAVPLSGNPYPGGCPLELDDLPGPGRYYYYVEMPAQGTFPAGYTRSLSAVVIPEDGGDGGAPTQTALHVPIRLSPGGALALPFDLAGDGEVRIRIYDPLGRRMRELPLGTLPVGSYQGSQAPVWDGADFEGRYLQTGMYFARLLVNGQPVGPAQRALYLPGP